MTRLRACLGLRFVAVGTRVLSPLPSLAGWFGCETRTWYVAGRIGYETESERMAAMALRAIFADFAAMGNEDGSFIDESLIDVLLGALASTQVSSLLDLSLLFDHDGDELRTEVGEFVSSNGCLEAEFLLFQVISYLKAARPEDLEDTPVIPGTGRRLPKRKLMYGRMAIDFESEYVAKRPRLQLPLPSVPLSSSRVASTRNIKKAESLVSAFSAPLSTSVQVAPKAGTISLLDKESKIRDRAADACFDLLKRVGASSSRYVVLFDRDVPPSQELLDVQRDLFMGSRASNSVLCMPWSCLPW